MPSCNATSKSWIDRLTERNELMGYREARQKQRAIGMAQIDTSAAGEKRVRYLNQTRSDLLRGDADGARAQGRAAEIRRGGHRRAGAGGRSGGGGGRPTWRRTRWKWSPRGGDSGR